MDQNWVTTILAEKSDGSKKTVNVVADPTSHRLKVTMSNIATASDNTYGARNENQVPVLIAVSAVDGKTPIPIYADSNGAILII